MTLRRGVTVLDLIDQLPPGAQGFLPARVAGFLELLSIVELESSTSGEHYVHRGLVQSAVEAGLDLGKGFPLEIPGLNRGVRFQFSGTRATADAAAGENVEPEPVAWQLDLVLDRLSIPFPGVKPGTRVPSAPAQPAHLLPDKSKTRVLLHGRGVLRIAGGADGTSVGLVADPDPFDPDAPLGTVLQFGVEPNHLLFMDNGLGMTIGEVVWDQSEEYTPPEIMARGHDPRWRGLSVGEASFYLPRDLPVFGDVSLGVRDLLLGLSDPGGVQLEAYLELGKPAQAASEILWSQELEDQIHNPASPAGPGLKRIVTLHEQSGATARVRAVLPSNQIGIWKAPGDTESFRGPEAGWFRVRPNSGQVLRFRELSTNAEGKEVEGPEVVFRFVANPPAPPPPPHFAPLIRASVSGGPDNTWLDVAHMSGDAVSYAGLSFKAEFKVADAPADSSAAQDLLDRMQWELTGPNGSQTAQGEFYTQDIGFQIGAYELVLRDPEKRRRRLAFEVLPVGILIVGADDGPRKVDANGEGPIEPTQLLGSFDLQTFHEDGKLASTAGPPATWDGVLTVPVGVLAEVALEIGTAAEPDAPAPPPLVDVRSHLRIFMPYDDDVTVTGMRFIEPVPEAANPWGPARPYPKFDNGAAALRDNADARAGFEIETVRTWTEEVLQAIPAAVFVVIGRCCDLTPTHVTKNRGLAIERATRGVEILRQAGVDPAKIIARGEQGGGEVGTIPSDPRPAGQQLDDRIPEQWQIKSDYAESVRNGWGESRSQPEREEARGADIYAFYEPQPAPAGTPTDVATQAPSLRRTRVPGVDVDPLTPIEVDPHSGQLPFRVEILARWDSPTYVDSSDAIPTLAQLTVDWQSRPLDVPGGGQVDAQQLNDAPSALWRVIARFSHDPRGGAAEMVLALDTPGDERGIATLVGDGVLVNSVAAALGFGPALLGSVTSASAQSTAVRLGALIAAVVALTSLNVVDEGEITLQKVEARLRLRDLESAAGLGLRLVCDYSVTVKVNATKLGVTTDKPIKVRYKNVGLEYDNDPAKSDLEKLNLVYDDADFEIVDPGKWRINGWLGELLGVTAVRLGTGSMWFEIDLELALDLGVVEISKATIRIAVDGPNVDVDLRGLAATVNVPGTVEGTGQLQVADGGAVSAALDVNVIPAEIKANATLRLDDGMTHLEAGVRFATGIPLAGTGLGIYGFVGRFVSNGTRALDAGIADPVQRELNWFSKATIDKYVKADGQYALGFGAVVGTLPDAGFTFNAIGMLAVEFPDPSVVFSLDATLASSNDKVPAEQGPSTVGADFSAKIIGLIAIDSDGLALGVKGKFEVPKLLRVVIPVSSYFPFQDSGLPGYLRIGADGFEGRAGGPVTVTTLPDILDYESWSYFMVEEKQLMRLGGNDDFSFNGFSIGFGAGWSLFWGGDRIHLSASATVLVGVGTRPLTVMGGVFVKGELWLVVAGVSATGELVLRIVDQGWQLRGELCGRISCFFFSIEGCVSFELGSDPSLPPPQPEPLVSGVSLSDKFARVVGEASTGAPGTAHTAWPDCVPVIHIAHRVQVALQLTSFKPTPEGGWTIPAWTGTSRLKYLFRLERVDLLDSANQIVQQTGWPSVWWMPSFRPAVPEPGDTSASEQEGWDLALLSWEPAPWARNLPDGGDSIDADPADNMGRVCDPPPHPGLHCALGRDVRRLTLERTRLQTPDPGTQPYSPYFVLSGTEGLPGYSSLEDVVDLAVVHGLGFLPGGLMPLPAPFQPPRVEAPLAAAYRLPRLTSAGQTLWSLQWDAVYASAVVDPDLVLALCLRTPPPVDEICVDFNDLPPGDMLPNPFFYKNLVFTDPDDFLRTTDMLPEGVGDGDVELAFGDDGLVVDLPVETDKVEALVGWIDGPPLAMEAFDASGVPVGIAEALEEQVGQLVLLRIEAPGVARLVFTGGFGAGAVDRLCYRSADQGTGGAGDVAQQVWDLLLDEPKGEPVLPEVIGTVDGPKGTEIAWPGEVIGSDVVGDVACLYLGYAPVDAAEWSGVRVSPFPFFDVAVVSSCATSAEAQAAWEQDEATREDLQDALNDAATGTEEDRHIVLDAGSLYKVRVRYRTAAWQYDEAHPEPPSAGSFDWASPPAHVPVWGPLFQTFQFRTAAEGPVADEHVLSYDRQQTFDARALRRYLLGFEPETTRPVTFLDDSLWVHFAVEWIETLADRYGYTLEMAVRRTDPPPPAPGDVLASLEVPIVIVWGPLPFPMQEEADQNVATAVSQADCVTGPPHVGGSAEIQAELEPDADYDLVVWAEKKGGAQVEVGRGHFHTSKYRGAAELVAALGFTAGEAYPIYPFDFLATADPPADVRLGEDQALDDALAAMGMDPWPLPEGPRTVLVWRLDGAVWKLAAALLDSDESMVRGPRLEGGSPPGVPTPDRLSVLRLDVLDGMPLVGTLHPLRGNRAGTRLLLAAATPFALPAGGDPRLLLAYQDRGAPRSGSRFLHPIPHLIAQEQP